MSMDDISTDRAGKSGQADAYAAEVVRLADELARRGWLPATSGNLSVKVEDSPLQFAITRSGADKQHLRPTDVIRVDAQMQVLGIESDVDVDEHGLGGAALSLSPSMDSGSVVRYKPSAETVVHVKLYERFHCGSVLHVHTLYNNLASQRYFGQGAVTLNDHELLKALDHWEPNASIRVPIVENYHDIPRLGDAVDAAAVEDVPGVLVRNHGIYVWGADASTALRYLEAFEFLFQYDALLSMVDSQHAK